MANSINGNIYRVDTDGNLDMTVKISHVTMSRADNTEAVSLNIKTGGSGGTVIYSIDMSAYSGSNFDGDKHLSKTEDVCINIPKNQTPYVDITGTGAVAFLHLL